MFFSYLALGIAAQSNPPAQTPPPPTVDPYRLSIGRPGTVILKQGEIKDTATGAKVTVKDIARAAEGHRFVYLGESHTSADHHKMQAAVIQALAEEGRDVIVGFEMFTRPIQPQLNGWTLGWWDDATFIQKCDWKTQWGFPFELYKPIFDVTKKFRLPMVAMNAPREWVRQTSREGFAALPAEIKAQFPTPDLKNNNHRDVFNALMGGHPMTGVRGENIYTSQVIWDTVMADSAIKYLAQRPNTKKTVFVVVAGSGHVMYGQGINYRIWQRTGEKGITFTMVDTNDKIEVSRGMGEFVFAGVPPKS